jgi:hypothetical protein
MEQKEQQEGKTHAPNSLAQAKTDETTLNEHQNTEEASPKRTVRSQGSLDKWQHDYRLREMR